MPNRSYHQHCALARTLDVVGDRWSMLIIRNLLLGPQLWSELLDDLPGIARNLLSARLARLIADGLLEHDGERYGLTPRGAALQDALFALSDWGDALVVTPPEPDEPSRSRYTMTAIRRKLGPTDRAGTIQLWIDDRAYAVEVGPSPRVEQGVAEADVTVRCSSDGFHALMAGEARLAQVCADGQASVEGDAALFETLAEAFSDAGR